MLMKLLMVALVWLACLLPYLSAKSQRLLNTPLASKALVWFCFSLFIVLAVFVVPHGYSALVASLIVLMLCMCLWIGLVFLSSHLSMKVVSVNALVLVLFSLVAITGAHHGG